MGDVRRAEMVKGRVIDGRSITNRKRASEIMSIRGVVGIAQGESEGMPCVRVYVVRKTKRLIRQIPAMLDGYPVLVKESGKIRALPA